ncbi:hypothetical protein HZS_765, partial [Henneguya salminicola]
MYTSMDDRFKVYDENTDSTVDMRIRFFKSYPKILSIIITTKTKVLLQNNFAKYLRGRITLSLYFHMFGKNQFKQLYQSNLITKNINNIINTSNIISSLSEYFPNRYFINKSQMR